MPDRQLFGESRPTSGKKYSYLLVSLIVMLFFHPFLEGLT